MATITIEIGKKNKKRVRPVSFLVCQGAEKKRIPTGVAVTDSELTTDGRRIRELEKEKMIEKKRIELQERLDKLQLEAIGQTMTVEEIVYRLTAATEELDDVLKVKLRIRALLRERRVTENQLANDGRFSQKVLNNQISHKATLTAELLLYILDRFPDVSADWLMRGNIANNTTVNDTDAVRGLVAQLAEKDKQIGQLLQIISQRKVE